MTNSQTHRASIRWSPEQERLGIPDLAKTVDPAWFAGEAACQDGGWSLACKFDRSPRVQGNPSLARVRYVLPDAPHAQLVPGARLQLFERATSKLALVEILD